MFNDIAGTQRVVTADKAGYGYLLTQGNLCDPSNSSYYDSGCVGFATGDPGSWTFGAAMNLPGSSGGCASNSDTGCDRVTGMAFYDQKPSSAAYLYYWPNSEKLVGLELSDNTTTTAGQGSVTWTSGSPTALTYTPTGGGSCTVGSNCLTDQVVPGDTLEFQNCSCSGSSCPVVTMVTFSSMTVNIAPPSGCAANTAQPFSYFGYFINPKRDNTPPASAIGYPGGAVTVSAHKGASGNYLDGVVWAIAPNGSSEGNEQRGLGTLYGYTAASPATVLTNQYTSSSTDIWCSTSYALPTVTNGQVFVPTFAVSTSGNTFANCPPSPNSSAPPSNSGILVYY